MTPDEVMEKRLHATFIEYDGGGHVRDRYGYVWRVVRDGGMVTRADGIGIITMGIAAAEAQVGPLRPLSELLDDAAGNYCSGCGGHADDPHRAGCPFGEGCPVADPSCETDDGATHDGCEPADPYDPRAPEVCRVCGAPVVVMAHRGTGLCGQRCAKEEWA